MAIHCLPILKKTNSMVKIGIKLSLIVALTGLFFLSCPAQNVVVGKYKGHNVKVRYYKGNPDNIELLEYGLVTELNSKIKKLEGQVSDLKKKLAGSPQSGGGESATVMELRAQVWAHEKEIKDLRDSIAYINTHGMDPLVDSILTLNQQNESLAEQIRVLEDKKSGKGGKVDVYKVQIRELEAQLKEARESNATLDRDLKETAALLAQKRREVEQLNADMQSLNLQKESLTKTIGENEKSIASLQKELAEARKGKTNDPSQALQEQLSKIQKQVEDLTARNKDLTAQVDRMESTNRTLTENNQKLESQNQTLEAKNRALTEAQKNGAGADKGDAMVKQFSTYGYGHHIGVQYRVGLPQLLNPLLSQEDGQGERIWTKNITLSHHVGLFYGSASLTKNFPLTIGVGVEYGKVAFAAGIGHFADTIQQAVDADNDTYTAYMSYDNISENVALHYVSLPITLSMGQPRTDRITGYGQITLAPSVCVANTLMTTGTYNRAGYYSQLAGCDVDLFLDDMPSLGYGDGYRVSEVQKEVEVSRFVLMGRLSAGFYMPLCNTGKGKTCPCVFKMGVSVDFSLTPIAKELDTEAAMSESVYRLGQYNLLNGKGCRFVNPVLEVGLIYIIEKK